MSQKLQIVVTGANGQLGSELRTLAASQTNMVFQFLSKQDLDIAVESWVQQRIAELQPDVVINAAAYTNVEKAEEEIEAAEAGNGLAPGYLAAACKSCGAALIHISTDYVFNGGINRSYTEDDEVAPLNAYGKTKLHGERNIDAEMDRYFILRTSWLYSLNGHNFYKTMLRLASEHGKLRVVSDQKATPTYARILAGDILQLIRKKFIEQQPIPFGLYHYTHEGEASWFDFAKAIMNFNRIDVPVEAVSSDTFSMKATRPAYSKLDISKWKRNTGIEALSWQEALQQCVSDSTK